MKMIRLGNSFVVHLFIGKRGSVTAEIIRSGCVVFIVVRKSMIKRFETEI